MNIWIDPQLLTFNIFLHFVISLQNMLMLGYLAT